MSSSSAYSLQLPYLGSIPLGKSPPNLTSFQKPLRELYIPYYRHRRERFQDERRVIISDRDILIFEPDAASKGKRSLIYSTLESIVDVQALELYVMFNPMENHHHKRIRAAFLPIGCEHQERFRSLYSTIDKSQYSLLSLSSSPGSFTSSCHPPLVLFVMRKTGTGGTCSLLDCHVFAVRKESIAFELCDMIRKLIIKRTMSPLLPTTATTAATTSTGKTLLRRHDNMKEMTVEKRTKFLDRDRPISSMEHRQADIPITIDRKSQCSVSNVNLNDIVHTATNGLTNPLSTSSFILTNHQNSHTYHEPTQVLNVEQKNNDGSSPYSTTIRTLSTRNPSQQTVQPQQRHFIKASSSSTSLAVDESDEVVNDLMNIVVAEKLKTIDTNVAQAPVKRHASFDHASFFSNGLNEHSINKKRFQFQNNNKRSFFLNSNPLPTILSANNTPVMSRTTTAVEQPPQSQQQQQQTQPSQLPQISETHFLRPQVALCRYGDIGNYVPKLLRENVTTTPTTMRSSDSNENIFFRATNGHILNGFLNLDFSSSNATTNGNNNTNTNNNNNNNIVSHYNSTPCLNEENPERFGLSFLKQLRRNQTSCLNEKGLLNQVIPNENINDDHAAPPYRIPRAIFQAQQTRSIASVAGGVKVLPSTTYLTKPPNVSTSSIVKPRRVASFSIADTELPIDYRQYLRHTDQGVQLYGEEQQRQRQQKQSAATLEHSLGYFP